MTDMLSFKSKAARPARSGGHVPGFMRALLFLVLFASTAQATDYRLGAADKLRIRVVEWQTAEGTVRDWSSISGDYTIGPSGAISLPFIGEMLATGRTTAEIGAEIGDSLQQKFGLTDRPEASVEIAEFRPIFISGDVQAPGRYPFDPGLTVLKAVSLAGGMRRSESLGQRFERDFINSRGNYEVLIAQRNELLVRRARLIAEATGSQEIELPKELADNPDRESLLADETAFKAAREKRIETRLGALDDLKELLGREIASLDQKIVTQNRQIELATKELDGIGDLAERGLVVNSRVLSLERTVAELQSKILDMETAMLRAKQGVSEATRDAVDLQSERDTEIAQQRQQTEAEIKQLDLKIDMYHDLMAEALANAPEAAAEAGDPGVTVSFAIVRTMDGEAAETAADENTSVLPGDVVKVDIVPVPVQ